MKWRRILSMVAALLAMNGSMLGSDPENRLQARWSELKKLIGGKKVALQLKDGERVKGRVKRVTEASIVLWAKRSYDNPKAQSEIARGTVSRIEALDVNVNLVARRAKKTALTVGAALGTFLLGTVLIVGATDMESLPTATAVGTGAGSAVAVLMNLPRRSKNVTLIEIVPDSPGENRTKPANMVPRAKPTDSGAVLPSLNEASSRDRLHLQARRAVMRQDLLLDLSSRPVHASRSGIE